MDAMDRLDLRAHELATDEAGTAALAVELALEAEEAGAFDAAAALYGRAVALQRACFGVESPEVAATQVDLGHVLGALGQDVAALDALASAVRIFEADDDPADLANALVTAAPLHLRRGNLDRAGAAATRALDLADELLALDGLDDETREVLGVLQRNALAARAEVERAYGSYQACLATSRRVLELVVEAVGPDAPETAVALNGLGIACKYAGAYTEAEAHYRRALALLRAHGLDGSLAAADVHHNLAGIAHSQGRFAEGLASAEASVRLRREHLGPDHPDLAADLHGLAAIQEGLGQVQPARDLYRQAIALVERTLGPDHLDVAVNLNNLASIARTEGHHEEAVALYRRALAIKRDRLGDAHPNVAMAHHNLGVALQDAGAPEEAATELRRAADVARSTLPPQHPLRVMCEEHLAEGR